MHKNVSNKLQRCVRQTILFVFDTLSLQRNFWCVIPLLPLMVLLSPLWISWVQGYFFDMNLITFISPSFWKAFMFSFSFCPHFIHYVSQTHTALFAFCCCCHWLLTARQRIAFCQVLLHQTSTVCSVSTHTHAHVYRDNTNAYSDYSCFFVPFFLCICHCFLFVFLFLHFMFCWQLNGTGRFHGLASLDDITAIISTPPLGGFQVATPASPIWC